jgi:hypothetical protein
MSDNKEELVPPEKFHEHINEYFIFRTETEEEVRVGKLLEVDLKSQEVKYVIHTGKDKGQMFSSNYLMQGIRFYDEDSLMLALVSI